MKRILLIFSLILSAQSFAQDTIAVNSIQEAITETEKGNYVSLGLLRDTRKSFPLEFFSIPKSQLVGLVIDNCHYTKIPELLQRYTSLVYFRYSWFYGATCPIDHFPAFLPEATSLETIKIEGVPITTIPSLKKLTKLESLKIYMCGLPEFPRTVLDVTSLVELNLSCNDFTSIPDDIDRLINLKTLDFEGGACGATPISIIPSSIGSLTNLESLSFGYTKTPIETMPDSFFELTNLKYFECHGCDLTSLSEKLSQLDKLEYLQLTNISYFSKMPEALFNLPNLRSFRFYQYGPKANFELLKQEKRINTWGETLENFEFEIKVSGN